MKFSDIDFSAISQMMNNMSDEEKDKLNNMAENMMNKMKEEPVEEQEEVTLYEYLHIEEEPYSVLESALDFIEQAVDIEQYYEDTKDVDFSACILYYTKAILHTLRNQHFTIYKNVLQANGFSNPSMTTVQSYLIPLMNEENLHLLADEQFGSLDGWVTHKNFLQQVSILLSRAEFDFISYEDLQSFKQLLFEENNLLNILELTK